MEQNNTIVLKNLSKKFGDFVAVNSISLEVKRGEIFGFLGANGSGKTTTIRMLCGLSRPTSGCGLVAGYDLIKDSEKIKKSIGYMSQKFSLYDGLSVKQNIKYFAAIYGVPKKEVQSRMDALLDAQNLLDERDTIVGRLPIGLKQKIAFVSATIHRPKILFLDEPTGGVDPLTRRQFWRLIYQAADEGCTAFVTTHYMDEAEYCNRVAILSEGNMIALDSPNKLMSHYGVASMDDVFILLNDKTLRKQV